MENTPPPRKPVPNSRGRTNRTLSLTHDRFLVFKSLVALEGKTASEAVDELIAAYVAKAKPAP